MLLAPPKRSAGEQSNQGGEEKDYESDRYVSLWVYYLRG